MKLTVYGSRGSEPTPSRKNKDGTIFSTLEYGGNTSCYYLEMGEEENKKRIILDAGTGITHLGDDLIQEGVCGDLELLISHAHWDHIQGFPFFTPAYLPHCKINIYGEAPIKGELVKALEDSSFSASRIVEVNGAGIKNVFEYQQNQRNFPVDLKIMQGIGEFIDFIPGGLLKENEKFKIETLTLNHPGGSVSYKFTDKKTAKVFVYSTDFEPDKGERDARLIKWWHNADLVIADAQYEQSATASKNPFKETWGHSDPFTNIDYAKKAGVKNIIMTHHDIRSDDDYLQDFERRTRNYAEGKNVKVAFAKEGMQIEI